MRKIMDEKKILIVNLAKGRVGEDTARLLGAMIVTKLYLAAMSRVDILDESKRSDFFLYVDEFQNFATESFANILSEARKYRLSLILAHQYMAQLAEEVRDAVIGNVGTMLAFRVGAEDAEFLEKEFGPDFMTTDIVNLGFAQIYLKLMIDGVTSRPFSSATLPPIKNEESSFRDIITEASRKNYGSNRVEVEQKISQWMTEMDPGAEKKPVERSLDGENAQRLQTNFEPPKPQVNLYDAVCFVCGKKTQVPFQPDPNRPVFCKEHIGLAGQYKDRAPKQEIPRAEPPRPPRSGSGEFTPRFSRRDATAPERQQPERTVSLRDLQQRRPSERPRFEPVPPFVRQGGQPFKNPDNLEVLREALKKSIESKKNLDSENNLPSTPLPYSKGNGEEKDSSPQKVSSGTLSPGEKIEL